MLIADKNPLTRLVILLFVETNPTLCILFPTNKDVIEFLLQGHLREFLGIATRNGTALIVLRLGIVAVGVIDLLNGSLVGIVLFLNGVWVV